MVKKISFAELFQKTISILEKEKIPYMLVGGLAVNYFGQPRFTADIDLVITIDVKKTPKLIDILKKNKYIFPEETLRILIKASNVFQVTDPSGIYRIDFWIPKTNFEKNAFERKIPKKWHNKTIYLPTPEDLLLFKIIAGRAKDLIDIEGVMERQKGKLDKKYLNFWAMALDKEKELKKYIK